MKKKKKVVGVLCQTEEGKDVNLYTEKKPTKVYSTSMGRRVALYKKEEYIEMGFNIMLEEIDDFIEILKDIKKLCSKKKKTK